MSKYLTAACRYAGEAYRIDDWIVTLFWAALSGQTMACQACRTEAENDPETNADIIGNKVTP